MNPYLRLFAGISLVSPLVFAFFSLDFDDWTAFWITFIIYAILYSVAVLLFNYLETGNALQFALSEKWELVREGQKTIRTDFNPLWGMGVIETKIVADVYRKRLRNGTYKYKTIPRN